MTDETDQKFAKQFPPGKDGDLSRPTALFMDGVIDTPGGVAPRSGPLYVPFVFYFQGCQLAGRGMSLALAPLSLLWADAACSRLFESGNGFAGGSSSR